MALPSSYRESQGDNRCDNCGFLTPGLYCTRWDATVEPQYLCDSWKPKPIPKPGVIPRSRIKGRTT